MKNSPADPAYDSIEGPLSTDLLARIMSALRLPDDVPTDYFGLSQVYAAWCKSVPFDNIRKMTALREPGAAMPGLDATDFFENWLMDGIGGTCWPSSNALYVLLRSMGFEARRVAGAMYDLPEPNHGTVKVRIDGKDWMVDSSMLTYRPLPLEQGVFINDDPAHGVEIESSNGSHIVWRDFPPAPEYIPCRLLLDPAGSDLYLDRYENFSREQSPFNHRLYFRKGGPDGAAVVAGDTLYQRTSDGLRFRQFDGDGLCSYLQEQGVSGNALEKWIAVGCLESSLAPSETRRPEITAVRPSQRH